MGVWPACVYVHYMCSAHTGQQTVSDLLEAGLHIVVSCHWEMNPAAMEKQPVLSMPEPFLQTQGRLRLYYPKTNSEVQFQEKKKKRKTGAFIRNTTYHTTGDDTI